jgi:hypothetical protein
VPVVNHEEHAAGALELAIEIGIVGGEEQEGAGGNGSGPEERDCREKDESKGNGLALGPKGHIQSIGPAVARCQSICGGGRGTTDEHR